MEIIATPMALALPIGRAGTSLRKVKMTLETPRQTTEGIALVKELPRMVYRLHSEHPWLLKIMAADGNVQGTILPS